jgi:hypothetical protein
VPECPGQSSELAPPTPSTASECVQSQDQRGEGHTLARGKVVGGANADEETDTMVFRILIPSLCSTYSLGILLTYIFVDNEEESGFLVYESQRGAGQPNKVDQVKNINNLKRQSHENFMLHGSIQRCISLNARKAFTLVNKMATVICDVTDTIMQILRSTESTPNQTCYAAIP